VYKTAAPIEQNSQKANKEKFGNKNSLAPKSDLKIDFANV